MSGFEIVGVVLGAIPLIISGLEHYAEGVATIKVVCRAAREFRAVARKLEAEEVVFRNTITILLNGCSDIDIQTSTALLGNIGSKLWEDDDVRVALEGRLHSSLKSYREHITSIATSLNAFKERLHLSPDGKVCTTLNHVIARGPSADFNQGPISRRVLV